MVVTTPDVGAAFKKAEDLFAEAKAALTNESLTPEERQNTAAAKMNEAKALQENAMQLQDIDSSMASLKAQAEKAGRNGQNGNGHVENDRDPYDMDEEWTPEGSNYKTNTGYIRAILNAGAGHKSRNLKWFKDEEAGGHESKATLVENVGALGGFLVPVEFRASVMALAEEASIVRGRATIIRMARRQLDMPVLDQTGTTAGISHMFGGMQWYWTEEAAEKTETNPTWRKVQLVAHKLAGYTRISDELLDDSAVSLTDFLMGPMGIPGGIADMEDYHFFQGNGAGQPLGVINAGATITWPRAVQASVTYDDLVQMIARIYTRGGGMPIWVAHHNVLPILMQINGPAGNPSYLWGNAAAGVPATLLGYPIIFSDRVPRCTTTSNGDIGLYNFKYYLIGDRQATTLTSTIYESYLTDRTTIRVVHRVDGQPWLSTPYTTRDGTHQLSPFVILGAKTTS